MRGKICKIATKIAVISEWLPQGQPSVAQLPAARLSLVGSPGALRIGSPDWPSGLPLRINSLVPLLLSRCPRRSFRRSPRTTKVRRETAAPCPELTRVRRVATAPCPRTFASYRVSPHPLLTTASRPSPLNAAPRRTAARARGNSARQCRAARRPLSGTASRCRSLPRTCRPP